AEARVEVVLALAVRPTLGAKDEEVLVRRDPRLDLLSGGVDLLAQILRFPEAVAEPAGAPEITLPLTPGPLRAEVERPIVGDSGEPLVARAAQLGDGSRLAPHSRGPGHRPQLGVGPGRAATVGRAVGDEEDPVAIPGHRDVAIVPAPAEWGDRWRAPAVPIESGDEHRPVREVGRIPEEVHRPSVGTEDHVSIVLARAPP